jgi:hypothetical protein
VVANYQDEAIRSIIRASAWRTMRGLPWWISVIVSVLFILFGGK